MPSNLVKETIDERILRILGLEDVFDLDYDTYSTLLKEATVRGAVGKNKIPEEELALLSNERKRVRGQKGRFTAEKKKISPAKIATSKFLLPSIKKISISSPKLLPGDEKEGSIQNISKKLDEIIKSLVEQNKLEKKSVGDKKKSKEDDKRRKKEERLEGGLKALKIIAEKVLSPVQGILDNIVRFILFTVLGRSFKLFMDWASDPKNKGKLESVGRFLKDWWPALLSVWFFFANPLGKFIRTIVGTVLKLTFKITKFAIPKLLSFIIANPYAAAVAAIVGTSLLANEVTGQRQAAPIQAENKARAQSGKGIGIRGVDTPMDKSPSVGDIGPTTPYGLLQGIAKGGFVNGYSGGSSVFSGIVDRNTGHTVSGAGPDTQFLPVEGGGGAVLQKGESVLQVGARERMIQEAGVDPLAYNIGSNANKPRSIGSNVLGSLYGGLIGLNRGGEIGGNTPGGNNPNFWITAAIAGKEAGHIPQGQADVAQSIYNRAKVGIYPGGKDIKKIITAPGQYQPTFKNPSAWSAIRDKNSAIKAVGDPKLVDMASNSITNPSLQRNAASFVGSRSDFMGESQKPHMKPDKGDITRGKRHNFFGWFTDNGYKSKLPSAALSPFSPSNLVGPKIVGEKKVGSGIPFVPPFMYNQNRVEKKQEGGLIGESTGYNIPGATADRQLINVAVQPGEAKYIFTKTATERGAVDLANLIQARLDPTSAAAMKSKYTLSPPNRKGRGGVQVLPPIKQSSGSPNIQGKPAETIVPSFSVVASAAYKNRMENIKLYGIE